MIGDKNQKSTHELSESEKNSLAFEERKSKNLLWVGCISIVMIFAGLTSAYVVVKGNGFWVEMQMPVWFIISTVIILLSSLTFFLALKAARRDNKPMVKTFMALTVLGGLGFSLGQYMGWKELIDNGYNFVGKITAYGKYGEDVNVSLNGKPIDFDGQTFSVQKEPLSADQEERLRAFFKAIADSDHSERVYELDQFPEFTINFLQMSENTFKPLEYKDGRLHQTSPMGQLHEISYAQGLALEKFATNMVENRGYFFMKGTYGEDFRLVYKGVPLTFENGQLYAKDRPLSQEELATLDDSRNTASSFVFLLSFLHLLHLIGGLIYVIRVFVGSVQERYDSGNYLKIKLGSIFWHFLGGLWIYLYLFLTFIH